MDPFVSNTDFLTRYDARVVGQLVSDDGTEVDPEDLTGNTNLTTALADASGEVVSACCKGGRYSEEDLENLTGNSRAYLQRLVSDLAILFLVQRRGLDVEDYPQATKAMEVLEQLANGDRVFAIQAVMDAGHAASPDISVETIIANNYLRDASKMFPTRRWTWGQY